jgi:Ca2+-binding RTX toxin-like protein
MSNLFENLESRALFSVTASDFHSTLYVWGDAASNGISVEKSGADLVVKQYVSGSGYGEIYRCGDAAVDFIRVYGYDGADTISIADNVTDTATVYGGRGGDYLKGGGGMSYLWGHGDWAGSPDFDPATDDGAADILVSGPGYAIHYGQNGNDSFYTDNNASSSYDVMYGGNGNDRFYVTGQGSTAYAMGEAGGDTFYPSQSSTQLSVFYGGDGWDETNYRNWTQSVYVRPDGSSYSGLRYGARQQILREDVEFVEGTDYADWFSGSEGNNTFYGWGGDDVMFGNGGDDLLVGQLGNDALYAGAGNDTCIGSEGNDTIYCGDGNDYAYGNAGSDDIHGEAGNDCLYGQEDGDWVYGDAGDDLIVGGAGADYLDSHDGVFGNDTVYGDNTDGTGAWGNLDVAYVDRQSMLFFTWGDNVIGVESVGS